MENGLHFPQSISVKPRLATPAKQHVLGYDLIWAERAWAGLFVPRNHGVKSEAPALQQLKCHAQHRTLCVFVLAVGGPQPQKGIRARPVADWDVLYFLKTHGGIVQRASLARSNTALSRLALIPGRVHHNAAIFFCGKIDGLAGAHPAV